jgi:hypothetical protein
VVFSQDLQLRYTLINSPYLFSHEKDPLPDRSEVFPGEDGARLTTIN